MKSFFNQPTQYFFNNLLDTLSTPHLHNCFHLSLQLNGITKTKMSLFSFKKPKGDFTHTNYNVEKKSLNTSKFTFMDNFKDVTRSSASQERVISSLSSCSRETYSCHVIVLTPSSANFCGSSNSSKCIFVEDFSSTENWEVT